MQSSTVASFGMLMVLEMAPEMKGWLAAIMRMWLSTDRERLPLRPQGLAQSNTAQMLLGHVRRAFQRHGPAHVLVGGVDVLLREAEVREQVEGGIGQRLGRDLQRLGQELLAERPVVEDELDVEGRLERGLELAQHRVGEALGLERGVVDGRRLRQRAVADRIGLDLGDLRPRRSRACAAPPAPPG